MLKMKYKPKEKVKQFRVSDFREMKFRYCIRVISTGFNNGEKTQETVILKVALTYYSSFFCLICSDKNEQGTQN